MEETLIDCLLEDLGQILSIGTNLNLEETVPIKFLCDDLKFIKDFLRDYKEKCNEDEELKILVTYIKGAASKALVDLDLFTVVSFMYDDEELTTPFHDAFGHSQKLRDMILEIKSIKRKVLEIYDKKSYGTAVPQAGNSSTSKVLEDYDKFSSHSAQEVETSTTRSRPTVSRECKSIVEEETMVGFEDDAMVIIERLTGVQRQLDVIPIVGMGGLGKTTIARKVYNDPLIAYHFYIRGWIYVSQEYNIRDLLLGLLSYVVKSKNKILLMSEEEKFGVEKLGEELHRCLKGMRYLIVLDDIWDLLAWNAIKIYLPNDNNGSRILLTSRLKNVALGTRPCKPPHCLRFLTKAESWDLLKQKTFGGDPCPPKLRYIGKKIAKSCQGLPLGIVVVAGLLAKERREQKLWNEFAKRVKDNIVGDTKNFMNILEMSYSNLPYHLQMCFTFFGAFKIHHEIPVWKLICFWIARGFIPQIGEESLEDVAEGYLMDLIDRSLVIPAKKSSDGKIKACRIHDILHDLCLRKATELQLPIYQHGRVNSSSGSISFNYPCFLSHDAPDILGMPSVELDHFLSLNTTGWNAHRILNKIPIYKHLRVFDLWDITLKEFPVVVSQLVHLRYLALQVYFIESLPTFISNLLNLETLILRKRAGGKVTLPHLWRIRKLRHLRISAPLEFENPCNNWWYYVLNDLQTISTLCVSSLSKDVLEMTPNLRKLGLFTPLADSRNFGFPDLAHLVHLRTLKLEDWRLNPLPSSIPQMSMFPPNLQKLTLLGGRANWKEMSTIGMLPKLEVLKLTYNAFKGQGWETPEGGFHRLKFLKLKDMDLEQWIASSNTFPCLQRLVLDGCRGLKELPSGLCNTPTLVMIELYRPRPSVVESARKINKERRNFGDDGLKILIYHQDRD